MKTWQQLWDAMENEPAPPSVPGKHRASSMPAKWYCTSYESDGGSDAATRGKCLHWIMENDSMPFDIPEEEEEQIEIAKGQMEWLESEGWGLVGNEIFLETEVTTVNMDVLLSRGNDLLYVDFKFGKGLVEPDSPQMGTGADAIYRTYDVDKCYTAIIQPGVRAASVPFHFWTMREAAACVLRCIEEKMGLSKYCQYCKHSGSCDKVIEQANLIKELHES